MKTIDQAIKYFCEKFPEFDETNFVYTESDQTIHVQFPDCFEPTECPKETFLDYVEEYENIEANVEEGTCQTEHYFFQLVVPEGYKADKVRETAVVKTRYSSGIEVSLQYSDFLVSCAALELGAYDRHYFLPNDYIAIRIRYPNTRDQPKTILPQQIVDAFLFELAHTYEIVFSKSCFLRRFVKFCVKAQSRVLGRLIVT